MNYDIRKVIDDLGAKFVDERSKLRGELAETRERIETLERCEEQYNGALTGLQDLVDLIEKIEAQPEVRPASNVEVLGAVLHKDKSEPDNEQKEEVG